jgi:hypothetical protein
MEIAGFGVQGSGFRKVFGCLVKAGPVRGATKQAASDTLVPEAAHTDSVHEAAFFSSLHVKIWGGRQAAPVF